jgi:FkbM family methyltransferase
MVRFLEKINIILKLIKIFKNWYLFPIIYLKLVKNETVIFETKKGTKMKIRVNSTDLMALINVWAVEEYSKKEFEIKNDDSIIDIGGHIGLFSLYVAEKCKSGKIFTFEPIKENFDLLKENIKINNIKNIFPKNIAVSNNNSSITIFLSDDQSGHGMYKKTSKARNIKSTNLEEIYLENKIPNCNLLKIDAEGAEFEILEKIDENMFKKIENIIFEYHKFEKNSNDRLENIIKKLKMNGFKINKKPHSDEIGLIYAIKKFHKFS